MESRSRGNSPLWMQESQAFASGAWQGQSCRGQPAVTGTWSRVLVAQHSLLGSRQLIHQDCPAHSPHLLPTHQAHPGQAALGTRLLKLQLCRTLPNHSSQTSTHFQDGSCWLDSSLAGRVHTAEGIPILRNVSIMMSPEEFSPSTGSLKAQRDLQLHLPSNNRLALRVCHDDK